MSAKYELLASDTARVDDFVLRRIRALRRIETPRGPVEAGELGGYVGSQDNLSQEGECWVAHKAKCFGAARVEGDALVADYAVVRDGARVYGGATVAERARILGGAAVGGSALVLGDVRVGAAARVCTAEGDLAESRLAGHCVLTGECRVGYGSSMKGGVYIGGDASVEGAVLDGSAFVLHGRVRSAMQMLILGPWRGTKACGTFTVSLDRDTSAVSIRGSYFEEGYGSFDTLDAFVDDYIKRFGLKAFLKGEAFQYVALMRSMLNPDTIPM